ncbi:MAG: acyl carrier protein [Bacteroidetes bacterium]|nr:acyl carrier protein [Bacteroidota bacterium]
MSQLAEELKTEIIKALNLEGVSPADIDNDAPLFGEGLGLDSIDALELIVLLDKNYGIKIDSAADGKTVFHSVSSMVAYIESKK